MDSIAPVCNYLVNFISDVGEGSNMGSPVTTVIAQWWHDHAQTQRTVVAIIRVHERPFKPVNDDDGGDVDDGDFDFAVCLPLPTFYASTVSCLPTLILFVYYFIQSSQCSTLLRFVVNPTTNTRRWTCSWYTLALQNLARRTYNEIYLLYC